jgi:hypothetical protein
VLDVDLTDLATKDRKVKGRKSQSQKKSKDRFFMAEKS